MRRSFAVFTRALGDVWHGKKNVAKRMLKFFAKGEKSAGTALTRMLLSVHAHAVIKRVRVSEAFAIKLVERLDELLRARHISRFATFVDAIEKAEAGDDFDILGLRKDVLHRSACEGQVRRFLGVLAQGRSRAAFARLREQLGAGSNPPAVHADALAAGTTEATLLVALNGARERLAADAGGAEQDGGRRRGRRCRPARRGYSFRALVQPARPGHEGFDEDRAGGPGRQPPCVDYGAAPEEEATRLAPP